MLSLPLTMNLHLLRGRWWPILYYPVYSIVTTRKGVYIYQYVVYLILRPSSVVLQGTPMASLSNQVITGSPGFPNPNGGINLVELCYQSVALPLMTGGTYLCLSVALLVNSFTIISVEGKNLVVKPYYIFTREMALSRKLLCDMCEREMISS